MLDSSSVLHPGEIDVAGVEEIVVTRVVAIEVLVPFQLRRGGRWSVQVDQLSWVTDNPVCTMGQFSVSTGTGQVLRA